MKYYADVPYFPAAKNKLHAEVEKAVKEYRRMVFETSYLPVIQSSIVNVITQLNKEFPRCRPFECKWSERDRFSVGENNASKTLKDITLSFSGGMYSHVALILIVCREVADL